ELESILTAFDEDSSTYGVILRAKGIVPGDGVWYHFDFVPDGIDVREGSADVTGRLCVIGSNLNEAAIAALFGV
ncbi:MAG: GTP-binding protein, partial [Clostridia bacterium]|nr:GTP-binding protein [Clostridia bacterium]